MLFLLLSPRAHLQQFFTHLCTYVCVRVCVYEKSVCVCITLWNHEAQLHHYAHTSVHLRDVRVYARVYANMNAGIYIPRRRQSMLVENDIKHGPHAHWCKHGIVLLQSHAGWRDGFARSSSVAVGLGSRLLKCIAPPSCAHFPPFVFEFGMLPRSKLDGLASKSLKWVKPEMKIVFTHLRGCSGDDVSWNMQPANSQ